MTLERTNIHLHSGPLVLLKIEDEWSVYVNRYDEEVVLQHGTARVLVDFDTIIANLSTLWTEFTLETSRFVSAQTRRMFIEWLEQRTFDPDFLDDEVAFCPDCSRPSTEDLFFTNSNQSSVCEPCLDNYYTCADCEELFKSADLRGTLHDEDVCNDCISSNYVWCNTCDGLYHDESDDHDHVVEDEGTGEGCCVSPALSFTVRNDGLDPLPSDTITTVTLAGGFITDEGLGVIAKMLRGEADAATDLAERLANTEWHKHYQLSRNLKEVGQQWQTKRGNFTKRLSSYAHKTYGLRLPPSVLSNVGSIAADHSRPVDVRLEVSRDLNTSAGSWYHEGSCWFGGGEYAISRCALKTNGGFGLRTFADDGSVTGRAWVMPVVAARTHRGNKTFAPTFDTMTPDAFLVFNGYGDLDGYAPARIVAHMAGMTYRKIGLDIDPMYINSESGYLVGQEEVVESYTDGALSLALHEHSDLWAREQERKALADAVDVKTEQVNAAAASLGELLDVPF